jgi:hypothetical protein
MDELEWLKGNSPSTKPSRDITRRHRTQLRAAIATEGADGTQPRRPRRDRRSRHRVLVTGAVVVGLCALGAGVVALASSSGGDGDEHTSEVGVPAASGASSTTAVPATCAGAPPAELAIPSGFGSPVSAPAALATTAPAKGQQVTSWTSPGATIEQRWPADQGTAARFGSPAVPTDGIRSYADSAVQGDEKSGVRRTILFVFPGQPTGCASLQVTVSGRDADTVDGIANGLVQAPFVSHEPLVSTTGVAVGAPPVVACEGVTRAKVAAGAIPAVATVGGHVEQASFKQPTEALTDFLANRTSLAPRGYEELHLDDGSLVYVKDVVGNVVTTVHVVTRGAEWTVAEWQASGC